MYTAMQEAYVNLMTKMSKDFSCKEGLYGMGGYRYRAEFDNKYGISIVKHDGSYGRETDKWEIAVLHYGDLCYDTPITNDVIGWLTDEEVVEIFFQVKSLPKKDIEDEEYSLGTASAELHKDEWSLGVDSIAKTKQDLLDSIPKVVEDLQALYQHMMAEA